MKSRVFTLAIVLVLLGAGPVLAVPRVQSYIVGADYVNQVGFPPSIEEYSWITSNSTFTYKAVGFWEPHDPDESLPPPPPPEGYMEMHVIIGVPEEGIGSISINGINISFSDNLTETDFSTIYPVGNPPANPGWWEHEPMKHAKFVDLTFGMVYNDEVAARHYDHGNIAEWGWGEELDFEVTVRGFEWAHFDAYGIDDLGEWYINPYSHDATYYVPEPGTLGLLGVGLLGMVPILRRKKK